MERGERKLAFAVVNAINNTLKQAQLDVRAEARRDFEIRNERFVMREIAVISPFANVKQGRPYGDIQVGNPNQPKPRLLLPLFEEGAKREPFTPGAKRVAVPLTGSAARPSFSAPVPKALRFTALRFSLTRPKGDVPEGKKRAPRTKKAEGQPIRYGRLGTYLVPSVGVFQRTGDESRLLYAFDADVRLRPTLGFEDTVRRSIDRWMGEYLERELVDVLSHEAARGAR